MTVEIIIKGVFATIIIIVVKKKVIIRYCEGFVFTMAVRCKQFFYIYIFAVIDCTVFNA